MTAEVQAWRSDPSAPLHRLLEYPEVAAYRFLRRTSGNVQLRMSTISSSLGVEPRTLQRAFASTYGRTFSECQTSIRLEAACRMLREPSSFKIAAIASMLGYARMQDFTRFFKRHLHQSPVEWKRLHQIVGPDDE
jgi:AraC-like DNA-binding protein